MNESVIETKTAPKARPLSWKRKLALILLPCVAIPALIILTKVVVLVSEIALSLSIVYASQLS